MFERQDMKKCPFCAEQIQDEAIKCKHCKSELAPMIEAKHAKRQAKKNNLSMALLLLLIIGCIAVCIFVYAPSINSNSQPNSSPSSALQSDCIIKVSGTEDLEFNGHYMTVTASGDSVSKNVNGRIPQSYRVKGRIVSVTFQKETLDGHLKVQIMQGEKEISSSETYAAYGVVSIKMK